jgi:hypothetical protein
LSAGCSWRRGRISRQRTRLGKCLPGRPTHEPAHAIEVGCAEMGLRRSRDRPSDSSLRDAPGRRAGASSCGTRRDCPASGSTRCPGGARHVLERAIGRERLAQIGVRQRTSVLRRSAAGSRGDPLSPFGGRSRSGFAGPPRGSLELQ